MHAQHSQSPSVHAQQVQAQKHSNSNMEIYTIPKNTCVTMECSICYTPIKKYFAQCSAPCNKIFHTSCMEKMIIETEAAADEENKEAKHKCCYCRRSIDIRQYDLQEIGRQLLCLKRGGYDVIEALQHVQTQFAKMIEPKMIEPKMIEPADGEDVWYNVYYTTTTHFQKKPKQTRRSARQKINKQPRIHLKQNIGGRRRS
jgi:hypothetical protein